MAAVLGMNKTNFQVINLQSNTLVIYVTNH
jgi:hypothetical protein